MAKRIFLTGGSGFVGGAVIDELLARDYAVNALVNRQPLPRRDPRVQSIPGGLFHGAAVEQGMSGCDAVIHLVGIIMERPRQGITFQRMHVQGTQAVVDAAQRMNVPRFIHMSALGTRPDAASEYHRTKHEAEQYVQRSRLAWTIIRPSMIHGPRGELMGMEVRWARRQAAPFFFMPYFGGGLLGTGGAGRLQPVYVKDVARAFVEALEKPGTVGQVYELAGAEVVTWRQLHDQVAGAVTGHRRLVLPIPAWYARLLTRMVPASLLPFNRDQLVMSQEDNTCDLARFVADFGWRPEGFAGALESYAAELSTRAGLLRAVPAHKASTP